VIQDVDESLRTLIRRDALSGTDIEVAFDAPNKDWSSRRNAPTIDLYLYDIREDVRRREVGRIESRDADGRVLARLVPPRWFKLSYLLTAWTQRAEDEHRLLAACLGCFLRHDRIPPDVLAGILVELNLPVSYTIALPPPEDRALSDVWSALGGELKPSLDLVVSAPFDLSRTFEAGPPVLESPQLHLGAENAVETVGGRRRERQGEAASASPADSEARATGTDGTASEEPGGGAHRHAGQATRRRKPPRKEQG
jgi:hypothetical protein